LSVAEATIKKSDGREDCPSQRRRKRNSMAGNTAHHRGDESKPKLILLPSEDASRFEKISF